MYLYDLLVLIFQKSVNTTLKIFAKRQWLSCLSDWFRELWKLEMMSYEITLQFLHNDWAMDVFDRVLVWERSSVLNVAHVADEGEQEKRAEISTVFKCRVAEIILGECRESVSDLSDSANVTESSLQVQNSPDSVHLCRVRLRQLIIQ